jgi:hypothetical protein
MWVAIVVAVVWKMLYGTVANLRPVMGDRWGRWVGLDMASIRREDAMKAMPWAVLWSIVGVVLFDVVWSWTGGSGASDGLMVGLVAGIGLASTAVMVHPPFEQRPMALMWWYGVYHAIEWAGVGLVFGLIMK